MLRLLLAALALASAAATAAPPAARAVARRRPPKAFVHSAPPAAPSGQKQNLAALCAEHTSAVHSLVRQGKVAEALAKSYSGLHPDVRKAAHDHSRECAAALEKQYAGPLQLFAAVAHHRQAPPSVTRTARLHNNKTLAVLTHGAALGASSAYLPHAHGIVVNGTHLVLSESPVRCSESRSAAGLSCRRGRDAPRHVDDRAAADAASARAARRPTSGLFSEVRNRRLQSEDDDFDKYHDGYTRGVKKLLLIPLCHKDCENSDFSTTDPTTGVVETDAKASIQAMATMVEDFTKSGSFGVMEFSTTVATPVMGKNYSSCDWTVPITDSEGGASTPFYENLQWHAYYPYKVESGPACDAVKTEGLVCYDFDFVVLMLPRCPSMPFAGQGFVSVPGAAVYVTDYGRRYDASTLAHELAHNFGAGHSGYEEYSGEGDSDPLNTWMPVEYRDPYTIMGIGEIPEGQFIGAGKLVFDWLTADNVVKMAASDNEHCIGDCFSSATVHLAPSDSDRIVRSTASGKRAHQLIVIYTGIANHYYTVELKRRYSHVSRHALVHWTYCDKTDYIAANGRSYGSGEFGPSHLIDVTPATDSLDDAALPEGETYVIDLDEVGAVITVGEYAEGALEVSVHFVPTGSKRHDDHGATTAVTCGSTHTASLSMRGAAADAHEDYAIFDVHIQPSTSNVALGELTVKYTCSEGATARITVHDEFPLGFTKFGASSSIGAIATATVRQCQDGVTPAVLELKAKNGNLHTSESNDHPIDMYSTDTYVLVEMLLPESGTATSSPSATVELTVECEDADFDIWGDDFQWHHGRECTGSRQALPAVSVYSAQTCFRECTFYLGEDMTACAQVDGTGLCECFAYDDDGPVVCHEAAADGVSMFAPNAELLACEDDDEWYVEDCDCSLEYSEYDWCHEQCPSTECLGGCIEDCFGSDDFRDGDTWKTEQCECLATDCYDSPDCTDNDVILIEGFVEGGCDSSGKYYYGSSGEYYHGSSGDYYNNNWYYGSSGEYYYGSSGNYYYDNWYYDEPGYYWGSSNYYMGYYDGYEYYTNYYQPQYYYGSSTNYWTNYYTDGTDADDGQGCYGYMGWKIPGCSCYQGCRMCGYSWWPLPTESNNCLVCDDPGDVIDPNPQDPYGAGTCIAPPPPEDGPEFEVVMVVETSLALTGLTVFKFDDDARDVFKAACVATLDTVTDPSQITIVAVASWQGRRRRKLLARGIEVDYAIEVVVDAAVSADDLFNDVTADLQTNLAADGGAAFADALKDEAEKAGDEGMMSQVGVSDVEVPLTYVTKSVKLPVPAPTMAPTIKEEEDDDDEEDNMMLYMILGVLSGALVALVALLLCKCACGRSAEARRTDDRNRAFEGVYDTGGPGGLPWQGVQQQGMQMATMPPQQYRPQQQPYGYPQQQQYAGGYAPQQYHQQQQQQQQQMAYQPRAVLQPPVQTVLASARLVAEPAAPAAPQAAGRKGGAVEGHVV